MFKPDQTQIERMDAAFEAYRSVANAPEDRTSVRMLYDLLHYMHRQEGMPRREVYHWHRLMFISFENDTGPGKKDT
ncbi:MULTISPECIES: hypothetical protein [Alphaproteobacteria]|uniref:hypothetical protein n=1 Tax=Alphaproteobacteria TaxID=28211 RepID=UPI003263AA48